MGAENPLASRYAQTADVINDPKANGKQYGYINTFAAGEVGTLTSGILTQVAPSTSYTLTVSLGRGLNIGCSRYTIEVLVNNVSVATQSRDGSTIPSGTFVELTTVFESPSSGPQLGTAVQVRLTHANVTGTTQGLQGHFDNVRLDASPVTMNYTVTPSAGANGSISPNTVQTVASGGSVGFTATPNSGYVVDQWRVNGSLFQTGGNACTLSNITSNRTIQVTFAAITYTVTPSAGANGSISPNTVQSVASGGSVGFTATPNSGYVVDQWLVNGSLFQTGGNTCTLSNITSNKTIQVTFTPSAPATYVVTPSAGANGSISPNTAQTVSSGGSANFTATPNSGYVVDQWLVNGIVQAGATNSFTLSNITANAALQVTFKAAIIDPNPVGISYESYPQGSPTPSIISFVDDAGRFGGYLRFKQSRGKIVSLQKLGLYFQETPGGTLKFYEFFFLASGKISQVFGSDGTSIRLGLRAGGRVSVVGALPGIGKFKSVTGDQAFPALLALAKELAGSVKNLNQFAGTFDSATGGGAFHAARAASGSFAQATRGGQIAYVLKKAAQVTAFYLSAAAVIEFGPSALGVIYGVNAVAKGVVLASEYVDLNPEVVHVAHDVSMRLDLATIGGHALAIKFTSFAKWFAQVDKHELYDAGAITVEHAAQLYLDLNPGVTAPPVTVNNGTESDQRWLDTITKLSNNVFARFDLLRESFTMEDVTIGNLPPQPDLVVRSSIYFKAMSLFIQQCRNLAADLELMTPDSVPRESARNIVEGLRAGLRSSVSTEANNVGSKLDGYESDLKGIKSQIPLANAKIRELQRNEATQEMINEVIQLRDNLVALKPLYEDNVKTLKSLMKELVSVGAQINSVVVP